MLGGAAKSSPSPPPPLLHPPHPVLDRIRTFNNITINNEDNMAQLFNKYFINAVQTTVAEASSDVVV